MKRKGEVRKHAKFTTCDIPAALPLYIILHPQGSMVPLWAWYHPVAQTEVES